MYASLTTSFGGNALLLRARLHRQWRRACRLGSTPVARGAAAASLAGASSYHWAAGAPVPSSGGQRERGPWDFGHPARRVTDTLLVVTTLVFCLQWLVGNNALILLGAKVRRSAHGRHASSSCCALSR